MRSLRMVGLGLVLAATAYAGVPGRLPLFATVPAGFTETQIVTGLNSPTAMDFAPDGRIFVSEQVGKLRVIKNGTLLGTAFVDLTGSTDSSGERGFLGVAFDPNFASNQYVYVYHTVNGASSHNRVSRFTANGDVAAGGSETTIVDLDNLSGATNHNGGSIHFGSDGMLYISVGENANPSNAQTVANRLGKILRLNPDGTIPASNPASFTVVDSNGNNPTTASPTGANRAIWALGLRNPFTFAFQPGTGRMFINDVGDGTWEEVNDGIAGSNYGWYAGGSDGMHNNASLRDPMYQYQHGSAYPNGNCIAGGAFYPNSGPFPAAYRGKYFFANYAGSANWIATMDPAAPPSPNNAPSFATGLSGPVDLKVGSDGALYYLEHGGRLVKISYTSTQSLVVTPTTLTFNEGASGTFKVHLGSDPGGSVMVSVARTFGDTSISPTPTTLTFTSANYTVDQTVTVNSVSTPDAVNDHATITVSLTGATSVDVAITATDTTTGPTAQISAPTNNSTVSGTNADFFGYGTATGTATLVRADFYIDGVLVSTDPYDPAVGHFHYGGGHGTWNTTTLTNGTHTLRMTVVDSNNLTKSDQVIVTVNNAGGGGGGGGAPSTPTDDKKTGVKGFEDRFKQNCGCSTAGLGSMASMLVALAMAAGLMLLRRR